MENKSHGGVDLSRRGFLKSAGGLAAGGALGQGATAAASAGLLGDGVERASGEVEIELTLNGTKRKVKVEPRTTLLSVLRHRVEPALTGTKEVCDMGSCGACTVHVDSKPAYACLLLAIDCQGKAITTIEGLAQGDTLHPVQQAFCEHDALMCGFCTPGFVMALSACLDAKPNATLDELKEACAGNVCRCGTYPHVFQAAVAAQRAKQAGGAR
ncbi:MAG: (2Fe-2S)-binding protein [Planctomycetes bacterium]|nr:(2Fe-2S)-binding protein [Planctomycetota bacterium]